MTGFNVVLCDSYGGTNKKGQWAGLSYLIQDEGVEVRHVALVGDGALVIVLEVLLQGHGVVGDPHHSAQVVRQHLARTEKCVHEASVCGVHGKFFTQRDQHNKHMHSHLIERWKRSFTFLPAMMRLQFHFLNP